MNLKKFLQINKKNKYVVLDIPLLIENRIHKKNDTIIYVKATKKIIVKRLKKRGNYNKKLITLLKSQQFSMRKKIGLSNFVIENMSSKKRVLEQVKKIKKILND